MAAALGGASSARAAGQSYVDIDVTIQGISSILDLNAAPGSSTGTVNLSWTEPFRTAGTAPFTYDVRASSVAQIADDVAFSTAQPLSAFSPSAPPAPGAGGGAAGFTVTGLTPAVTYYFAIREKDSTTFHGAWTRVVGNGWNVNNFAVASSSTPPATSGVVSAVFQSSATATWAVSGGATDYVLLASTGAALPPTSIAASSVTASSTGTLAGLLPNTTYFLSLAACGAGCSVFSTLGSTQTLAAPATGLLQVAVGTGSVTLAWGVNGNRAGTAFRVYESTDAVSFSSVTVTTAAAAALGGLSAASTYYFEVVAVNGAGVPAAPSNVVTVVTPAGPVPSTPAGLTAFGGLMNASVSWTGLPLAQQGSGLLYYTLLRSTQAASGYVTVTTTTATSYLDKPLAAFATFYYKVSARDVAHVDSAPSAPAFASPYSIRPMEPLGLLVAPSSSAVTISWSPTTRFADGTAFPFGPAPNADELAGYALFRSTDLCSPAFTQVSTYPVTSTSLTDNTGGLNYYYRVFSNNTVGFSSNVVTLSSLGEFDFFIDDCLSRLVLDSASGANLNGVRNGMGDVRILRTRHPEDVSAAQGVYQSVEFVPSLDGATPLSNYILPKAARVVVHFDVAGGAVVPTTAATSGFAPLAGGVSPSNLGMFWLNGGTWQRMFGRVDAAGQTVAVDSPNLGRFQVRAQARSAGAVFDVAGLSSRVLTPNGDGLNDVIIFTYDPGPGGAQPGGKIFDLNGAFVSDMSPGLGPNTLMWNGRMNGMPVKSGVYVYRITGDGKTFSGTIVVAR